MTILIWKALKAIVTFLEWLFWKNLVIFSLCLDVITWGVFYLHDRATRRRAQRVKEAQRRDE
ncbi:MAG: hypothetical protein AAFV69_14385, partial [Pseudomonadota bacterium]